MFGGGTTGAGAGGGTVPWWQRALGGGLLAGGALFGGGSPYKGAQHTVGQIPGYFDPYYQAGVGALPQLQQQYKQLISDPGALEAKWGEGFKESPGYKYNVEQATRAANQAAAAGGMAGSPAEQQALAHQVSGMASQDYQDYMNRLMGMYGTGLGGERGLAGMGMQAGEDISQAMLSQAQMQMAADQARRERTGGFLGTLGGLIGGGGLFGGGKGGLLGGAARAIGHFL
jgi:hypothetical protein